MRIFKKLNSRKIGYTLAILFILGMVFSTIYSQAFVVRQKPFVSLVFTELRDLYTELDIIARARPAEEEDNAGMFDWIAVGTLYEADYIDDPGIPPPIGIGYRVSVHTATMYWGELQGVILGISGVAGDIEYTIAFSSGGSPISEGDNVRIFRDLPQFVRQPTVPIWTVHFDIFENQHYVYVVTRRDGAWGREFVAERRNINLSFWGQQGMSYVIDTFISDPIISWSDRPVHDGALVRLFD